MYKKCKKIVASIIVFIMMMANFSTLGIELGYVIAADINSQNSKTNNANVEFDIYFENGESKTHESTKNIGEENKIMADVTVKNAGYFKNAIIQVLDSNFKIGNSINSEAISNIDAEKSEIMLKQVNAGENLKIEIPIEFKNSEKYNPSQLTKVNSIKMTGTYVDDNGKTHNVKKEISLGLNWSVNVEAILEAQITKFVPFEVKEEKGLIVQAIVKAGIKENALPVKNTNIEMNIPLINNILPKDIKVSANSILATTGEESGLNFNENNYTISEGKISINVENKQDENGNISWKKQAQDEYVISFIYPEEVLSTINGDGVNITLDLNSNTTIYNAEQTQVKATFQNIYEVKEQLGKIVDYTLTANESISKGQIYANYDANEKQEIEYNQEITANIGLAELTDEIVIEQNSEKLKGNGVEANTSVSGINYTYYKSISIAKEVFNKILGEQGFIKIYSGETLASTIDNSIVANEEGNFVIDLKELNINNIKIQTSKPISEGKLEINIAKLIKGNIDYSKEQMNKFSQIELNMNAKAISNGEVLVEQNINTPISLVEPETQASIQISEQNLSTIVKNENIEIKAILNTTSNYNKLFKNPKITIELPAYMEQVDIKNVQLLYEDELTIEQANCIAEPNGTKKIEIVLKGTQTKYSKDAITGGANILITADITANNLTPNTTSQIKMIVTNDAEEKVAELPINFIAPVGIVTANKLINNTDGTQVMALTNDEQAELEVTTTEKQATAEIQIINNYTNKINNIRILGRTLMQGTTDTETLENLNNTFNAPMTSAINTNGLENVSIYYSENGNATEDLQNAENAWGTAVEDFSKVKSYLIVLNDYTMEIGNSIKFAYNAQIPENLNYSETVNSMYTVYFNNIQEEQIINDRAKSRTVTLATGEAPILEVKLESTSQENSTVREKQYVKFKATVSNKGTVDAENVQLKVVAPNGKIYTYRDEQNKVQFTTDESLINNLEDQLIAEYGVVHTEYKQESFDVGYTDSEEIEKNINIGTIKVGETAQVEYELKITKAEIYAMNAFMDQNENLILPEIILNNKVSVIANEMQKEVESNEYKLKAEEGMIRLELETDRHLDYTLIKGDTLTYSLQVEALKEEKLDNVVVKLQIPQGLKVIESNIESLVITSDYELKYTAAVDEENNVIFNIEELPTHYTVVCNVKTQVENIQGTIKANASATAEGTGTHYSNEKENRVSKLNFEIKQLAPEKQYVKEAEKITYVYEIKNTSDVYTNNFKFENVIPEGMQLVNAQVENENVSYTIENKAEGKLEINFNSFKANTTIILKVVMEATLLPKGQTEKEVTNYATISGKNFETKTSNSIKTIIEFNEDINKVDDGNEEVQKPSEDSRYKISGLAWIDKNENGQRDDGEEILTGMEVRLLNKNTNEIVKDIDSGVEKIVKTSSVGEYTFTNLPKGEYLVLFVYNTYKYELTEYKKANVNNTINSDVINVGMEVDGTEITVAVSDTLKITNSNIRNIDIGLIESEKSDMRIDKYVSAITVTYGNTVKTYNYEDEKIAKVEIPAKELNNATVIIEYKIVVKNEGAVGNFIRKVVDYTPKDMKFNSELNKDWYQSSNGDLYNSSLANQKLESGESATLSLTLTKKMTDNNTGIINNNAELYEVYNEEGKQDIDSTPGNKVTSEDDISAADVVVGVKTGDAVTYTALISVVICIALGVSTYYIRKKVLRRM